jgi:hypothetical protein
MVKTYNHSEQHFWQTSNLKKKVKNINRWKSITWIDAQGYLNHYMSFTYLFFPVIIWDSTYIYILLSVIRTFFPLISPGDIFKINKLN